MIGFDGERDVNICVVPDQRTAVNESSHLNRDRPHPVGNPFDKPFNRVFPDLIEQILSDRSLRGDDLTDVSAGDDIGIGNGTIRRFTWSYRSQFQHPSTYLLSV